MRRPQHYALIAHLFIHCISADAVVVVTQKHERRLESRTKERFLHEHWRIGCALAARWEFATHE